MKLVIGGAHQGKQQYAASLYKISPKAWEDGAVCTMEAIFTAPAIHHFHLYLRRYMESGREFAGLAEEILNRNPELLIVTDEVGYGVVPMDPAERAWREGCGRVCTALAAHADSVTRVCCGIGQKLK